MLGGYSQSRTITAIARSSCDIGISTILVEDLLFTRSSDLSRDRELEQLILGEDVLPVSADVGIAVSSNSVIATTVMASVDITVITFFFRSNSDDNFAVGIVRLVNAFHKRNGVTPPLMYVLATFRRPLIEESFNSFVPLAVNQLASMAIQLLWPYQ
uniref:Uncharacterized protein n=1 Tax=Glossina morsitans morsitans TaxID=37546 RepID=A0A1B0FJP0_GLOMM